MSAKYPNQEAAGKALAERLRLAPEEQAVVLAMAPGAVPAGVPVSEALRAPLDVVVARALCSPNNPKLVLGSVARDGMMLLDEEAILTSGLSQAELDELASNERAEMKRRVRLYRREDDMVDVAGKTAVLVCDGTEPTLVPLAIMKVLRRLQARRIVLVTPATFDEQQALFEMEADQIVKLTDVERLPDPSELYEDYVLLSDDEVEPLISAAGTSG